MRESGKAYLDPQSSSDSDSGNEESNYDFMMG